MAKEITAIPQVTTTERDALSGIATGSVVQNTTTGTFQYYGGATWVNLSPIITATTVDTTSFSPSSNFGTTTQKSFQWWRIGDRLFARLYWKAGTLSGTGSATITINNVTMDSAKLSSTANVEKVGWWHQITQGGGGNIPATSRGVVFYDGSTTDKLFFSYQFASNQFTKSTTEILSTNDGVWIDFDVPISGWSVFA